MEGQNWKIGSPIDVYIYNTDYSKIMLNPKFGVIDATQYVVYGFCGLFALLGIAQIFGTDYGNQTKKKLKKN